MLHLDWGGEYLSNEFVLYLKQQGMVQHLTVHNTPQHNGIMQSLNQMILKHLSTAPHERNAEIFVGRGHHHVVWLKNRTPTKVLDGLMPYESQI